jgi:hypothetical protein
LQKLEVVTIKPGSSLLGVYLSPNHVGQLDKVTSVQWALHPDVDTVDV